MALDKEEMNNLEWLTQRQGVLLKLLRYSNDTGLTSFRKRTFPFTEEEWKFLNSMVKGNCLWFGGDTTRENTKERAKVHAEELGLNELELITHIPGTNHRGYQLNKSNIMKYLLATLTKKVTITNIEKILDLVEEEYKVRLNEFGMYMEVSK